MSLKLQFNTLTNSEKLDIIIDNTSKEKKILIANNIIQSRFKKYRENTDQMCIKNISDELNYIIKVIYHKPKIMKKVKKLI
jgi:hypothetical protein